MLPSVPLICQLCITAVLSRRYPLPVLCIPAPSGQRVSLFEVLNRYFLQVFAFVCAFPIPDEKVEEDLQVLWEYTSLLVGNGLLRSHPF